MGRNVTQFEPLSETGEAIRRLGEKQSKGKVIITTREGLENRRLS